VVHLQKHHKSTISDGHTLMLRLGRSPANHGRDVLLFLTARLINPRGERVGQEGVRERGAREKALRDKVDRLIAEATEARKTAGELIKQGQPQEAHKKLLAAHWGFTAASSIYPAWKAGSVTDPLKEIVKTIEGLGFPLPPSAIIEAKPAAAEGAMLIDVKWIDFPDGPLPELKFANPAADRLLRSTDLKAMVTPMDQYGVVPMGIFAITAVFAKEQFAALLPAILAHKGVKLTSAPPVEVESGEKSDIKQEGVDDFKVSLEAQVGPDGHTIDLNLELLNSPARGSRNITTAVTIWNGQTVALGGTVPDDKNGEKRRIVFITAKLKKEPPPLKQLPPPLPR
jgi:hypothetical protein